MNQIQEKIQPLYDSGDLLGFSVSNDEGILVHNESYFNDELAWSATQPFVEVMNKMNRAGRKVSRLTVELDDVTLIYKKLAVGHTLYALRRECDLDTTAAALP